MKLHNENYNFEGVVPAERIEFKLKANAKLFGILSDGIYKDKVAAVIRELSCNAHDIHARIRNTKPFRVYVPTRLDPTFRVEDEGTGIDPARIADIYWTYGESSKTDSNDEIGALGLGSKSPFAYTKSSFTVKNRYPIDGKVHEHTYFCFINERGTPDGSLVSVEPTDQPAGITVELAARTEDLNAFQQRVMSFFKYWPNKPEIIGLGCAVPEPVKLFKGTNWYLERRNEGHRHAVILMGNVPYPLDINAVPRPTEAMRFVAANPFVITVPIGSVAFQVSREELSYEKVTLDTLEQVAEVIVKEFSAVIQASVETGADTPLKLLRNFQSMTSTTEYIQKFDTIASSLRRSEHEFKMTDGRKFTARQLSKDRIKLNVPGHAAVGIWGVNHDRYSMMDRWPLRQVREVRLEGQVPYERTDSKGNKVVEMVSREVELPWFKPSTMPVLSKHASTAKSLLAAGYTAAETLFQLTTYNRSRHDHDPMFVINDMGQKGAEIFRYHARQTKMDPDSTYFVEGDPKSNVPADFGFSEITSLLANTIMEGVEVVYLSKLPNLQLPPVKPKAAPQPRKVPDRSTVEVRMLTLTQCSGMKTDDCSTIKVLKEAYYVHPVVRESAYRRVPKTYEGLYVVTENSGFSATDKDWLDIGVSDAQSRVLPWLMAAGAFDKFKVDGAVEIIARKQEDIDDLIKKGCKLTRFSDYCVQFMTSKSTLDAYLEIAKAAATRSSFELGDLTETQHRPQVMAAVRGLNTYFERAFKELDATLAKVTTTQEIIYLYAAVARRGMAKGGHIEEYAKGTKLPEVGKVVNVLEDRYPLLAASALFTTRHWSGDARYKDIITARLKAMALYMQAADREFEVLEPARLRAARIKELAEAQAARNAAKQAQANQLAA